MEFRSCPRVRSRLSPGWGRLAAGVLFLWAAGACAGASYILEVMPGTDGAALAARYGMTVTRTWQGTAHWSYTVTVPDAIPRAVLAALKLEPGFLELEANGELRTAEADKSSTAKGKTEQLGDWFAARALVDFQGARVLAGYVHQPGTMMVRADEAHQAYGKGAGIVAIIDTGVDPRHGALRDVLLPGYDFTRDRADTVSEWSDVDPDTAGGLQQSTVEILDTGRAPVIVNATTVAILTQSTVEILDGKGLPKAFGHGTMIAGLIHRMAPEARILPLKAFRADGTASLSDIVRAIRYAAEHGATVISMSFSFPVASPELQAAVQYAAGLGAVCVASAGNNAKETAVYPAAIRGVIGVGSTNFTDRRSEFSNWGTSARTAAPGEAIVTTFPGNTYAGVWGTSFSTALVSGAMAVFREAAPRASLGVLQDALDAGVRIEQDMGDGRLDLMRSLGFLKQR